MATDPRSSQISVSFHPLQIQMITSTTVILCSERERRKKYLVVTERLGKWKMDWEIWERGGPSQCLIWYIVLSEDVGMVLILSWRRSLSYRSQSTDLLIKSIGWFLHDRDLRHERVKFGSFRITQYKEYHYH